ncbi:hypothetical protein [Chitinimonas naiadis]
MRLLALTACLALLAGCATQSEYVLDQQYITKVNEGARIGGGQIVWINYPTKRVAQQPATGS